MKLIIENKDVILKPLKIISKISEKRQILPILSNVLIEKIGKKIFFFTTNTEIQISTFIEIKQKDFKIYTTVSVRMLLDIIRLLPNNKKIYLYLKKDKLNVKSEKSKFLLQTIDPKEFPKIENFKECYIKLILKQKILKYLFNMVYFSMAQNDTRYYLNGLLFKIDNFKIYTIATDGHRLAFCKVKNFNNLNNFINKNNKNISKSIILPRKTIIELQHLLKEDNDNVKLEITDKKIKLVFSNIELISKLIEGNYPNYKNIIPKKNINNIILDRILLLKALQRISIMTNEKFQGVKWIIRSTSLKMISINSLQEKGLEKLEIKYNGINIDIGFNINYLIDIFNNLKSDFVNISFDNDSNSAVLISIPNNYNFKYVIMPMYI